MIALCIVILFRFYIVKMAVVLSLFDGISCGQVALRKLGIEIKTFISVEIEPNARNITAYNFPDTIHLHDVCHVSYKEGNLYYAGKVVTHLDPSITIVMGGSPCQGFSNAGKKLNFEDPRSRLYFEFERIVREINPRAWLLENVRMKKEWIDVISDRMKRPAVHIDSKYFTPLSRPRVYWFNWDLKGGEDWKKRDPMSMDGLFDTSDNISKFNVCLSEKALLMCDRIVQRAKERGLGYKIPIVTRHDYYLCLDKNIFKGTDGKRGIIDDGIHPLRMPTPLECERLQGLPDNYTRFVSKQTEICKTNRYKVLGNAWTVPVIEHILHSMPL